VAGLETRILDGNHLAASERRLKETRGRTAAPLPGKALVVYSPRQDAVVDVFPIEDGEAQERSGLDAVLETIRAKQLWVADRNFCTLKFLYSVAAAGARFVVRQHGQLKGEPVGAPQRVVATDEATIEEQRFRLPSHDGETLEIRRVIVRLKTPTRDGRTEIFLLTNLSPEEADAAAVADLYRGRWRIETMMQRLTVALRCEVRTLCYPKAALFAFALAVVMYNAMAIIRLAVDAAHGADASRSLSHFYMADEIAKTTDGMLIALPPERWSLLAALPAPRITEELLDVALRMNLASYAKTIRAPKRPKPKPKHVRDRVHVSAQRILDARSK
jgi:IS4 transposase